VRINAFYDTFIEPFTANCQHKFGGFVNLLLHELKKIAISFKDLIYPPLCLHCRQQLHAAEPFLCNLCLDQLEFMALEGRCKRCFTFTGHLHSCPLCKSHDFPFAAMAAVFEHMGPAATLIRQFKYGQEDYLYKAMSAYMAAQFALLEWPFPDVIIPIPISFSHRLERGYNQSALLAGGLSSILNVPVKDVLKRSLTGYSQAGLNRKQRLLLNRSAFGLKKTNSLQGMKVLLVDDVMTTTTTLKAAAETLWEASPEEIYALTFCCARKN